MGQGTFDVQQFWSHLSRDDQLDSPIVQNIDEPSEAPGLRGHSHGHLWHIAKKNGVKLGRQLQVIVL